jgi:hypothetical protein
LPPANPNTTRTRLTIPVRDAYHESERFIRHFAFETHLTWCVTHPRIFPHGPARERCAAVFKITCAISLRNLVRDIFRSSSTILAILINIFGWLSAEPGA